MTKKRQEEHEKYRKKSSICKKQFMTYYAADIIPTPMAYKKTESQEKAGTKLRKPRFDTFPKSESASEKPKKKLPYGQSGANYFEKRKKKPLGEDELPASRGFAKSKTGYNNPNAPWNREKSPTKKWDTDRTPGAKKWDREATPTRTWEEKRTPDTRGPLKTFAKK
jgi:hypothetical protein